MGTSEFYAVVEGIPGIRDSLVVHLEDEHGGIGRLLLFVVLEHGALDDELRRADLGRAPIDPLPSPRSR